MSTSANLIQSQGKPYHLGVTSEDIAEKIILVGDPSRAKKISTKFDDIQKTFVHREFHTFTGTLEGERLTVMSTGMGEGNMEITVIELSQLVQNPVVIRCGSCSTLLPNIELGTLVISDHAVDRGSVCSFYQLGEDAYKSDSEVMQSLKYACAKKSLVFHVGKTASSPGFYGPQGRNIEGFPIRSQHLLKDLVQQDVINLEMEIATLFALGKQAGMRCGAICGVYGNRALDQFISEKEMIQTEENCMEACLLAIRQLVV